MLFKAALVGFLAFVCYVVYFVIGELDFKVKFYKHYPGVCRRVADIKYGSEDIHVMSDGKAFISTGWRSPLASLEDNPDIKGGVLLFDFKNPSAGAVELKIESEKGFDARAFCTHGLSVLEDKKKGEHLIYMVNHPRGAPDLVEKFRYVPKTQHLVHERSIQVGDQLGVTNDLVVVKEDQFLITNCAAYHSLVMGTLENFVSLKAGGVFFYNTTHWREVVPKLDSPNGIFLSRDERTVYVVGFLDKTILVYRRDPATNGVQLLQTVQLHGKGDNIQLSQSGDALLVGVHPSFGQLLQQLFAANPDEVRCPSSVVKLPLDNDGLILENDITEMFYDHGDLISGASSAAMFDGQLLIGSVNDRLVHCQLRDE